jgi:hypothetical protein
MIHRPKAPLARWIFALAVAPAPGPALAFVLVPALVLGPALAGCTVKTEDNFPDPPAGPPATCVTVAAIDGCEGGSVSYACTADRPDDGDTNLVCSLGTPGPNGTTLYCCAPYGQFYSDCTVSTADPGCGANSFGFACSGATTPDQADPSLTCSRGAASGAQTPYCCTSGTVTSTCAPDPGVSECRGVAIGYSCVGPDAPAAANPSLACGRGTSPSAGATGYCCLPFAKSAAACDEDDAVPGCGVGSFGFTCAGDATPDATNASLHCGAGTPGTPATGATLYCCQLQE